MGVTVSASGAIEAIWRIESARLIAGLTRMVRDVGLAEELAQDALVAALEQWPKAGVPDNPGAWLMATAKHRAIDQLRRRKRFQWLRLPQLAGTRHEPESADRHSAVPEREHIEAILRTIAPENAAALLLHALEGYSYKEIAEIQGCSLTAVRSRIARAREAFRVEYATTEPSRSSLG